jgi:hypothetical protein
VFIVSNEDLALVRKSLQCMGRYRIETHVACLHNQRNHPSWPQ